MFTNNFSFIGHLRCYNTKFTVRHKYTIFNRTHRRICKLPIHIRRNICRRTYQVCPQSRKFNRTAGSIICTFRRNRCTCKSTVCRSSGHKEDTRCRGTFRTVGRRVVYLQIFTGSLRQICRRTATVTVYREGTTEVQHNLCKLVHRHTSRIRFLTTVVQHNHNRTIGFNTYHGTRRCICMIWSFCLIYPIFYNIAAGTRNNLIFPTVKIRRRKNLRHFNFGNIRRSRITILIKIFVDNQNRREPYVTIFITAICWIE